jgi:hypothetical protein
MAISFFCFDAPDHYFVNCAISIRNRFEKGWYVCSFFSFLFKFKFYPWKDISRIYIRQYSPIKEYGGWGIRFGIFGSGKRITFQAITVFKSFLQMIKILLGTQMPQQWEDSLKNIKIMNSEGYIQQ